MKPATLTALVAATAALLTPGPDAGIAGGGEQSWRAVIVAADEPGDRMVVQGTVYGPDGVTPLPGVAVHIHNTNARGVYTRDGSGEGRIEGSVTTDQRGRYEFVTVKPASYPDSRNAAHIHFRVEDADGRRTGATLRFADDPLIPEERRRQALEAGNFSRIRPVEKDADGTWRCTFDIKLDG